MNIDFFGMNKENDYKKIIKDLKGDNDRIKMELERQKKILEILVNKVFQK